MGPYAGRILGDYRIIEEIGAGGMGRVFLAENVHHKKRCALKMLPEEISQDITFRARFFDEARVMSDLNHPGIVRVHHTGEDKGVYYLVMDYVSSAGGRSHSIHDELTETPLRRIAPSKVLQWITQVARALAYAHHRGVIHRDIKPANILIDSEGNARITDFGLVKAVGKEFLLSQIHRTIQQTSRGEAWQSTAGGSGLKLPGVLDDFTLAETTRPDIAQGIPGRRSPSGASSEGTGSRSLFGTYDYMSPELLEGKDATPQSDIYSLGVMAYRMLTGRRPVGLAKPPSTMVRDLPRKWDAITARCLADNVAERYPNVDRLLKDLAKVDRRFPTRTVALTGVALLIVASSLALWTFKRASPPAPGDIAAKPPVQTTIENDSRPLLRSQERQDHDKMPEAQPPQIEADTEKPKTAGDDPVIQRLEQSLNDCYMLDDPLPGPPEGMTIRLLYDTWNATRVSDEAGKGSEVNARVDKLKKIEAMSAPADLVAEANAPRANLEAILTAWHRLGESREGWPVKPDQWDRDNRIRSELLDKLKGRRDAGLLSEERLGLITRQTEDARRDRERTLKRVTIGTIDEHLRTIGSKSAGDKFLPRVNRSSLNIKDTDELAVLQGWETETRALADFASKSDWPAAYHVKKFYDTEGKGCPFLQKTSLTPDDLRDWQNALRQYPLHPPVLMVDIPGPDNGASTTLELRLIEAKGLYFKMGVPSTEVRLSDPPARDVQLSLDFYIGRYEITQRQYEAVTGMGTNPSRFDGANRPVENVSWADANEFCATLSKRKGLRFRLPREEEWECACRAQRGRTTLKDPWSGYQEYCSGDGETALRRVGQYKQPESRTKPVGQLDANGWGLHDMHGNVWEWCSDAYDPAFGGKPEGKGRVIRGGAYDSRWEECRSAWRDGRDPGARAGNIGFRVVLEVK